MFLKAPLMSLIELLPKILSALLMTIFNNIYKRLSRWLTDKGDRLTNKLMILVLQSFSFHRKLSTTTKP